jgi:hypothetical protein
MAYLSTKYEIAARHPDGRAFLIAYAARLSNVTLTKAIHLRGEHVVAKLGISGDTQFTPKRQPRPHTQLGEWWVGFTGRTMHDVEMDGKPLPFIGA